MWRQFPPNLKKNLPQNYVEAVPTKSQKESNQKLFGGIARKILKRIRPKIMWRQFPLNNKNNPPQNYVEAVPAKSQKRIRPKRGSSHLISKRIRPKSGSPHLISKRIHLKIMWRQFPLNLKKNPPQNYGEAIPAKSQKYSTTKLSGGSACRI